MKFCKDAYNAHAYFLHLNDLWKKHAYFCNELKQNDYDVIIN